MKRGIPLAAALVCVARALADSPLSSDDALKSFELGDPALRVELVAAEPLVESPCAIAFDERGRLFVAENRGYPNHADPPQGRIALLTDIDGDGRMDQRTIFADALTFPNGVMPWRGGVIVTCAPDVLYLKDTDGDGVADERRVLLTGFDTKGSTQLRVNCPTLGPDGWIWLAAGLSGGAITRPAHPERAPLKMTADVRFHPDTLEVENVDGRSQYGMSFDDFGRRFICMNRLPVQHVVVSSKMLARNPHLAFSETVQDCNERTVKTGLKGGGDGVQLFPISHNITTADSHGGSFSAACAITIWRGGALPDRYRNCAFSCDPTANLVHVDRLDKHGATFAAVPMFGNKKREFLASRDNWFRPVFLASGPDGALYVCDMVRKTIEHPDYLPEEVRKRTDFESGKEMGRIWRVISSNAIRKVRDHAAELAAELDAYQKSRPADIRERAVRIHGEEAIAKADRETAARFRLKHDIRRLSDLCGWERDTAHRLLREWTVADLESWSDMARTDAARSLYPGTRSRFGSLFNLQLTTHPPFVDPNERFRERSNHKKLERIRWIDPQFIYFAWLRSQGRSVELENERRTGQSATDFELALALGDCSSARSFDSLVEIALNGCADRWTRAAVLSGISGREQLFARALIRRLALEKAGARNLLTETCALPAIVADSTFLTDHLKEIANALRGSLGATSNFIAGIAEGLGKRPPESAALPLVQLCEEMLSNPYPKSAYAMPAVRALACLDGPRANAGFLGVDIQTLRFEDKMEWSRLCLLFDTEDRVEKLLDAKTWKALAPEIHATAVSTLISGPQRHGLLLGGIERGVVNPALVLPNNRAALLKSSDPAIRKRAEKLFSAAVAGDRMKAFEDAKVALALAPNAAHGREVFKTQCATCHRLNREGVTVGPDLLDIRNQLKESILFHIVVPDAEISPAFAASSVEMKDGRTLAGIITSETPANISLRQPGGVEETIPRPTISSIAASEHSLMPPGLESAMSRQDLADLLAWLRGED